MTDQDVLNELQYVVAEAPDHGASWPSGLWTTDEVIAYLNQRQQWFLRDTGVLLSFGTLSTVPQTIQHVLPTDFIRAHRVVWRTVANVRTPLFRKENWEIDISTPTWPYILATHPVFYQATESPSLELRTSPAALDAGLLDISYVARPTTVSNSGVTLTVPDEYVPTLKYGVLADMFSKVGRANDPARAKYCEARFQQGLVEARMLLQEWPA